MYQSNVNHVTIKFVCNVCEFKASTQNILKLHIISLHEGEVVKKVIKDDNKSVLTKTGLMSQKHTIHKNVLFKCELCGKQYTEKGNMKHHKIAAHSFQSFSCKQCEFRTKSKNYLRHHAKYVHSTKMYDCEICGKSVKKIKQHMREQHLNKIEMDCLVCKRKFCSKETLYAHMKNIHVNKPRSECNQCSKSFKQYGSLLEHIRVKHEGKKYKCNECDFQSTNHSALLHHRAREHINV